MQEAIYILQETISFKISSLDFCRVDLIASLTHITTKEIHMI